MQFHNNQPALAVLVSITPSYLLNAWIAAPGGAVPLPGCFSRPPTKTSVAVGPLFMPEYVCGPHHLGWHPPHPPLSSGRGSLARAARQSVSLDQLWHHRVSLNLLTSRYQVGIRDAGQSWEDRLGWITGRIRRGKERLDTCERRWKQRVVEVGAERESNLRAVLGKILPAWIPRGKVASWRSPLAGWAQSPGDVSLGIHVVGSGGVWPGAVVSCAPQWHHQGL